MCLGCGSCDTSRLCWASNVLRARPTCRIERLTKVKPHPLLRRHVFYAHRDLQEILDCYEKGSPFYLYTGRVSLHLRCS